ncbi:MAG: hypothetical protein K2V38_22315, partial [Gemmataceae bacterium]|nr:hypothetical protein [Gemmataceae bacterium]
QASAQEPTRPAPLPTPARPTSSEGYSAWTTDCATKVRTCTYTYANKDGNTSTQTVVIYTDDPDRKGWAYFFNADKKPWARCAVPGNPRFDPAEMCWQKLNAKGDGYEDFPTKGFCPTAKDGKSPIASLPLPPK